MTQSTHGGGAAQGRSPQLFVLQSSAWQGSMYNLTAVGGQGIAAQEGYYATAKAALLSMPNLSPKIIWFWGGYNAPAGTYDSDAATMALADRYIAMAADAAASDIKTVHWSQIVGGGASVGSEIFNRIQLFNDYYRDQLALLDGDHIFYDHRLTFTNNEFDGSDARDPAYFADIIHLTLAGNTALVQDFLTRFPNP
jgi:hypothetical protein